LVAVFVASLRTVASGQVNVSEQVAGAEKSQSRNRTVVPAWISYGTSMLPESFQGRGVGVGFGVGFTVAFGVGFGVGAAVGLVVASGSGASVGSEVNETSGVGTSADPIGVAASVIAGDGKSCGAAGGA
jgi:hypothetical protein